MNSILNGKQFNDSMKKQDAIFLTMRAIEESDYILSLDENLNQKVFQKNNPENIALIDGKEMTWENVIDEKSHDYTKKNDVPRQPAPARVVDAPVNAISDAEGKWINGHPNYGG